MGRDNGEFPDLAIRPLAEGERDAVLDLWRRSGAAGGHLQMDADIDRCQQADTAVVLVGEHRGRIIAGLSAGFDGHRGWIYNLALEPEHRGCGYGRRMLRFAERWLQGRGAPTAQLLVPAGNLEARRFCERLDYAPDACHIMRRRLGAEPEGSTQATDDDAGMLGVKITYLEMTERPRLPQVIHPAGITVALLRAHRPPIAFYRFLYDTVGEPWLWYERRLLADEALEVIIHDDLVEVYVLYADGNPAGFAELDRRAANDIELAYFGIMPGHIGQGLGRYLLRWAIDTAWAHEPKRLWVNTCTLDHPKALPLYQQMGFQPYKQVERRIVDPRLTGVVPLGNAGSSKAEA